MGRAQTSILRWGGLVVAVALSGCATDHAPIGPPRMPHVLAGPPAVAKPVLSRDEILALATERANREDVSGAVQAVQTLPAAERNGVARELIGGLARQDPLRAGRVALALPAGSLQTDATTIAVRAMLERDPDATVHWALALPEPAAGFTARSAVVDQLVEHDPRAALERLRNLPDSEGRDKLLGLAAAAWARRDAPAALARVRELPAGELRDRLTMSVGFAVAQTEPERAVAIVELLPEGTDRWLLFSAIGRTWVARNENAAWAWARQLPAGDAREAALSGIETGLSGTSSRVGGATRRGLGVSGRFAPALARDASSMPLGYERDQALRRQFDEALRESPVRAADWLASIPIPDRRDELVDALARQWLTTDPRAAKNWMDQNILLGSHREQLLREAGQ